MAATVAVVCLLLLGCRPLPAPPHPYQICLYLCCFSLDYLWMACFIRLRNYGNCHAGKVHMGDMMIQQSLKCFHTLQNENEPMPTEILLLLDELLQ